MKLRTKLLVHFYIINNIIKCPLINFINPPITKCHHQTKSHSTQQAHWAVYG